MPVTTRSKSTATRDAPESRFSWWARLYIYGIHGVAMEVIYTAIWEVTRLNFKAIGFSSIWAVFMYGAGLFGIEQAYMRFAWKLNFIVRGLVYTIWIYIVELICGILLEIFDAKPWDYKLFNLNLGGFVTLEYAPMWFVVGLATEMVIVKVVLNSSWSPVAHDANHFNDVPGHAVSVSHRAFFVLLPAVVALVAYIYFFLVGAYNNGEFYQKPENDLYRSID